MRLLEQYLHECIDTMEKDGNRLRFLGDLSVLTPELRELIDETNEISSRIEGFQANVCLNYATRFCTPPARLRVTARQGSRTRTL